MSWKVFSLAKNTIAIWLKVFLTLLLVLPVMGHCGSFTLGPGLGVERVNDTFNVDLDIVRGLYRFDNKVYRFWEFWLSVEMRSEGNSR